MSSSAAHDGTWLRSTPPAAREIWRVNAGAHCPPASAATARIGRGRHARRRAASPSTDGKSLWRQQLDARRTRRRSWPASASSCSASTARCTAFDGARRPRSSGPVSARGEPLTLRQAGVLMAVKDTLVVPPGRRAWPGSIRSTARPLGSRVGVAARHQRASSAWPTWSARAARVGNVVCAARSRRRRLRRRRARHAALDASTPAAPTASAATSDYVFGADSDRPRARLSRDNGERAWNSDKLPEPPAEHAAGVGSSVVVRRLRGPRALPGARGRHAAAARLRHRRLGHRRGTRRAPATRWSSSRATAASTRFVPAVTMPGAPSHETGDRPRRPPQRRQVDAVQPADQARATRWSPTSPASRATATTAKAATASTSSSSIDTGGFEPDAKDGICQGDGAQTRQAVAEADVVMFIVDAARA